MNKFRKFMYGRYGTDQLNLFLLIISIVLIIASGAIKYINGIPSFVIIIVSVAAWGIFILSILRSFSKNISARQKENYGFLSFWRKVKGFFKKIFVPRPDRKTHKYFKCPTCSQKVRVPRGKGKIAIKCPKCANKFIRNT